MRGEILCIYYFLSSAAGKNDFDGFEDDSDFQREGTVLDIVEVILQFLEGISDGGAVGVFNLRPAGQTRFN